MTAGVVLTGGRSSRMGTDKALVELDGVPMAVRVAAALRDAGCDPVWCQGGDLAALGSLGLDARPDPEPHAGPLSGIEAALRAAAPDDAVVAACDLPDLDAATVSTLVRAGATGGPPVVAAADADGAHLVAWWSARSAERLERLRTAGVFSYREALTTLGAQLVRVAPTAVRNVNRPTDLDRPARGPSTGISSPVMAIAEITVDELAERLAAGARLIDVREPSEYEEARVPGAVLVPLGTVPDHVDAFRGEGPTYVICRSGARSMRACEFVAEHGVDVVNVAGGTMAWVTSGRDYATGAA